MISVTALATKDSVTVTPMRVNTHSAEFTVKVNMFGKPESIMMANGNKVKNGVTVFGKAYKETSMSVNGKKINLMGTVNIHGVMVMSMRESGSSA